MPAIGTAQFGGLVRMDNIHHQPYNRCRNRVGHRIRSPDGEFRREVRFDVDHTSLSVAIGTDTTAVNLGRSAAGNGAAQADRRRADYAESWEVSDYHDSVSRVEDGPLAGVTIRELIHTRGTEMLGGALAPLDQFPLLVKFIDAHQVLSVQVHPDDATGRRLVNDNGKTEAWVILDAQPGSLIYAGLKRGVGRDEFRAAIEAGKVEPLLHRFEPRAGDSILIEAGTVHAIGAGVLLAEIQEMSDATFRIDDWGRWARTASLVRFTSTRRCNRLFLVEGR